jgi:hypothetical protein
MLRAIKPVSGGLRVISDAMLTVAPCAEPDAGEAAWSTATNYAAGDQVISTVTHKVYESLTGARSTVTISNGANAAIGWANHGQPAGTPVVFSTTGGLPTGLVAGTVYYVAANPGLDSFSVAATVGGAALATSSAGTGVHTAVADPNRARDPTADASADYWTEVGPTNRWRMFDLVRDTQTTAASPLTLTITPGERISGLALDNILADRVDVAVKRDGVTIKSYSRTLRTRTTLTWYGYFFGEYRQRRAAAWFDVPPFVDISLEFTFTRAAGAVGVGAIVVGRQVVIGNVKRDPNYQRLNFSSYDRDTSGNATFDPERSVPTPKLRAYCDEAMASDLLAAMDDLNALPAVWSSMDDSEAAWFEPLLVLGVYRSWSMTPFAAAQIMNEIELEGA